MTRLRRATIYCGLLIVWILFAVWQYGVYRHERTLAREILHRQSHSIMNALVGGIRSHRRLGRFFQGQLQGVLDELVKSDDILAVAIDLQSGKRVSSAGDVELFGNSPLTPGDHWESFGFQLVEPFELSPVVPGQPAMMGPGRGYGRRQLDSNAREMGPFSDGGKFIATLILDRTQANAQCRSAALGSGFAIGGGALILMCVAMAWRANVRVVEVRGRTKVLELEARHLRELSQAAAGLAHETRNPLGLVRGLTQQLAQSDLHSDEQRERVQAIVEECDRITARINQFIAYAKPNEPIFETIGVSEVVAELAALLQPDLEAKGLSLSVDIDQTRPSISADRELFRQAMFNLIQNAIQFSPKGETVDVSIVARPNGRWAIEVADRGPGVAGDDVERLFTPYFTTRPDGTGLGLAIVARLTAVHGWNVEYVPRSGGGAIFRLDNVNDG